MKRLIVLVLFLSFAAGFVVAEEIGLTFGLEFGITEVNKPNEAEDIYPYLEISVEYEKAFFDDSLDIFAGLVYDIGFTKEADNNGKEVNPNGLDLDLIIGYNVFLSSASTLSVILENNNYFQFAPAAEDSIFGLLKPGFKYNHATERSGYFYFTANVPFAYLYFGEEKNNYFLGLDFSFGWTSYFGLGLEATGNVLIIPKEASNREPVSGFTGVSVNIFFETESIYAEIAADIPIKNLSIGAPHSYFTSDAMEGNGVSITPMFRYTFNFGLSIYANCTFDGIGVKDKQIGISPAIGVTYSF